MTNCPHPERLSAYYDRELPESEQAAIRLHLADCDLCSAELGHYQFLTESLSHDSLQLPGGVNMNRLRGAFVREQTQRQTMTMLRWISSVAACLLVGASMGLFSASSGSSSVSPNGLTEMISPPAQVYSDVESYAAADMADMVQWIANDLSRRRQ
jgi:anti-sigma factor RsiW